MTELVLDPEPCAWLVGRPGYWRPCMKPSTVTVTDGQLTARVCDRHRGRAIEHGWRGEAG